MTESSSVEEGARERQEGGITKPHEEIGGGDVCVHYFDCGDDFMVGYM